MSSRSPGATSAQTRAKSCLPDEGFVSEIVCARCGHALTFSCHEDRAVRMRMGNFRPMSRSVRMTSMPEILGIPRSTIAASRVYSVPRKIASSPSVATTHSCIALA